MAKNDKIEVCKVLGINTEKLYINVWAMNTTGLNYMHEQDAVLGLDNAIAQFWQEKATWNTYRHTLVLDLLNQTFETISLPKIITDRQEQASIEAELVAKESALMDRHERFETQALRGN